MANGVLFIIASTHPSSVGSSRQPRNGAIRAHINTVVCSLKYRHDMSRSCIGARCQFFVLMIRVAVDEVALLGLHYAKK